MVMQVTSPPLQETLDQWDHMFRFGLNVPRHFIVHDDASLMDLFQEWCPQYDLERLKMYQFERNSDEEPENNLTTSVNLLSRQLRPDLVKDFYYLALPYIDENLFVMSGWAKAPTVNEPFEMSIGYRKDHKIPYEDDPEDPCTVINFDPRDNVPHEAPYFVDIKRMVCGFPYEGVRMTWSITSDRIGRNNANLCFWDYQVDEQYIRD